MRIQPPQPPLRLLPGARVPITVVGQSVSVRSCRRAGRCGYASVEDVFQYVGFLFNNAETSSLLGVL